MWHFDLNRKPLAGKACPVYLGKVGTLRKWERHGFNKICQLTECFSFRSFCSDFNRYGWVPSQSASMLKLNPFECMIETIVQVLITCSRQEVIQWKFFANQSHILMTSKEVHKKENSEIRQRIFHSQFYVPLHLTKKFRSCFLWVTLKCIICKCF